MNLEVAVIIPCLNEAKSIGHVVREFKKLLPNASVYVYDNASTDNTSDVAREAGAIVRSETKRGKGNVVRRMFADVDADIYVLIDGDLTYDISNISEHIMLVSDKCLDMLVGARSTTDKNSYRAGHVVGNIAFNYLFKIIFGSNFIDIFSGYRIMSRRFVKTFPALTSGFEIETELTVHSVELKSSTIEVEVGYRGRLEGTASKLNTIHDGIAILIAMFNLYRINAPMKFYGFLCVLLMLISVVLGVPLIINYMETGLVPRVPTAILASSLIVLASIFLMVGLILNNIYLLRCEIKRSNYLRCGAYFEREGL